MENMPVSRESESLPLNKTCPWLSRIKKSWFVGEVRGGGSRRSLRMRTPHNREYGHIARHSRTRRPESVG